MRKDVMIRRAECRVFGNCVEVETKAVLPSNNEMFFHFSALYITILEEAYISQEQNILRDKPILYPIVNVNIKLHAR